MVYTLESRYFWEPLGTLSINHIPTCTPRAREGVPEIHRVLGLVRPGFRTECFELEGPSGHGFTHFH